MAQGFRMRCEPTLRQRRREMSLEEARKLGAKYCGGKELPKTVCGLERAKSRCYRKMDNDKRAYAVTGYGMLAVWTTSPLEVHLYFGD